MQGFFRRVLNEEKPSVAPSDDNVSADSWFKQLDPGSEKELMIKLILLCTLVYCFTHF